MAQFKESRSQLQDITLLPEALQKTPAQPAIAKKNWFQHRFGKEHAFGSAVLLVNILSTSLQIAAGHKEKDRFRLTAGILGTALTAWTFLSSRGARMPQGETFMQRLKDAIKHPDQSAVHFAMVVSILIVSLATAGHIRKGFSKDIAERTRVASGEVGFLSIGMMTIGLFKEQQKGQDTQRQQHPETSGRTAREGITSHIRELYKYAWQTDKRGVIGRYISLGNQVCDLSEAMVKKDVAGKASTPLLISALLDMLVLAGQSFYFYERLKRENAKTKATPSQDLLSKPAYKPLERPASFLERARAQETVRTAERG